MVYLGVNSNNGSSSSTSGSAGHNKNGSRTPELVDLDTEKPNERNGGPTASNGGNNRDHNQIPVTRDSRDSRDDREDSGSEEDSGAKIRVGKDYQVITPNWVPPEQRRAEQCPERALLVWSPNPAISQTKLDQYIQVSKEKYGYNAEQALGMLFWHKHDLDRAIQDLANFTPFPDEWTVEDKVLFEQAFQFHGKSFHRIRQMLPDKSIAHLVKYYYSWKKTRTRTSLMDRQARKLQIAREQQGYCEGNATTLLNSIETSDGNSATAASAASGTPTTAGFSTTGNRISDLTVLSDDEEKEAATGAYSSSGSILGAATPKPRCFNCGILCNVTHATPKGQMCGTCHQYYQRTGHVRPTTAPARRDGAKASLKYNQVMKNNSRPPKGMYINHDDLVTMATGPNTQGEHLLKSMDREIVSYKRVVQNNKQLLSALHRKSRDRSNIEPYKIPTDITSRINAKWSNEELLLGVQGVRTFGKNFTVIAEVIGTKTESHVRSFFVNYRRRYNLDTALKEYEAEHGPTPNDDSELLENGVGGKSGNSSGSGTPRGQNSGSVSPTHESNISGSTGGITAVSKSLDSSGPGNKMDTTAS